MKYLFVLFILLISCASQKRFTEKAYIAYGVYPSVNCTVHQFISLSYTEGRDELLDSAICDPGDTIIIKDIKRPFYGRVTYFFKP